MLIYSTSRVSVNFYWSECYPFSSGLKIFMIAPNFLSFCLLQFSKLKLLISHNNGSVLYPVGMNSGQLVYVFLSFGGRKCLLCFGGENTFFQLGQQNISPKKQLWAKLQGWRPSYFLCLSSIEHFKASNQANVIK